MTEKRISQIDNIVSNTLKDSKSLGVFPTPIDKIVRYANLRENNKIDLNQFNKSSDVKTLGSNANLANIRGMLDREQKVIYIDSRLPDIKKRFVRLHEVGHELCIWQGNFLRYLDDDDTLNSNIGADFEAEANYFASASLFQQDYFTEYMDTLPLRLKSAIELAKMFGASIHASLRRMVERNDRRCALLVLSSDNESTPWLPRLKLKNYFQSDSFTKEFGYIKWASPMELDLDFVRDHMSKRKFLTSTFSKKIEGKDLQLGYDYFDNKYNVFVLLYPIGENCV